MRVSLVINDDSHDSPYWNPTLCVCVCECVSRGVEGLMISKPMYLITDGVNTRII